MYSRPPNRDSRIPPNYGGSIFSRGNTVTPVENLTHRRVPPQRIEEEPLPPIIEEEIEAREESRKTEMEVSCSMREEKHSLLSPLGHLGTEELLLLALALIIFQDGKEPELALILLALLFIN